MKTEFRCVGCGKDKLNFKTASGETRWDSTLQEWSEGEAPSMETIAHCQPCERTVSVYRVDIVDFVPSF